MAASPYTLTGTEFPPPPRTLPGAVNVAFPDVPGARTFGVDEAEALAEAVACWTAGDEAGTARSPLYRGIRAAPLELVLAYSATVVNSTWREGVRQWDLVRPHGLRRGSIRGRPRGTHRLPHRHTGATWMLGHRQLSGCLALSVG